MVQVVGEEFDIVPFPIDFPKYLFEYVPENAKYYMTIYDDWGEEKLNLLEALGCSVDVMWRRTEDEKVTSGTQIRSFIIQNKPWRNLVPKFVYDYAINKNIESRLKKLKCTVFSQNNSSFSPYYNIKYFYHTTV
jgi:nicotinamide-nucleotide adenylyltransferase/phosphinothricin biosynthesis protein PhpF